MKPNVENMASKIVKISSKDKKITCKKVKEKMTREEVKVLVIYDRMISNINKAMIILNN